jgi:uncharacterized membrane protein YqiK
MMALLEIAVVVVVVLVALRAIFRVQPPRGRALIITRGAADGALQADCKSFRVLASGSATRLPWSDTLDTLDLSGSRFDVFVPWQSCEIHATAMLRVSTRESLLRRAAIRLLGSPDRDIDALGESLLEVAVRDALAGRSQLSEADRKGLERCVRENIEPVAEELGLEVESVVVRWTAS